MESKTIIFTVDRDSISPRTEQKAGVQGNHNITEVRFEGDSVLSNAMENSENYKVRMQFIDGAGGFYSSGFLTVYSDETDGRLFVTCPIPNNVTNAGGLAYVYLVVTEIDYGDGKALENQVYISPPGKLLYTHSGVGSPSEYAYKVGITNALINAEIFAGQAERYSNEAKNAESNSAKSESAAATSAAAALISENNAKAFESAAAESESAADESATKARKSENRAGASAEDAETSETNARNSATNARLSANAAENSATAARQDSDLAKKYRNDTKTMFDNFNGIQLWQPNTEYKVDDVVIGDISFDGFYYFQAILFCKRNHTSEGELLEDMRLNLYEDVRSGMWNVKPFISREAETDSKGNYFPDHYATKEELEEAIGQALEGDY